MERPHLEYSVQVLNQYQKHEIEELEKTVLC